jgi:anaerobic selenocysteine-containing dehydrogenase
MSVRTERYPLNLLAAKPHTFINSCFANLPKHRQVEGEPVVLIHPSDAAQRGIVQGQPVQVFNDRGKFQIQASVSDAVQPGVVAAAIGHWRKLSLANSTLNATTSATYADLGHTAAVGGTFVEIAAIE